MNSISYALIVSKPDEKKETFKLGSTSGLFTSLSIQPTDESIEINEVLKGFGVYIPTRGIAIGSATVVLPTNNNVIVRSAYAEYRGDNSVLLTPINSSYLDTNKLPIDDLLQILQGASIVAAAFARAAYDEISRCEPTYQSSPAKNIILIPKDDPTVINSIISATYNPENQTVEFVNRLYPDSKTLATINNGRIAISHIFFNAGSNRRNDISISPDRLN